VVTAWGGVRFATRVSARRPSPRARRGLVLVRICCGSVNPRWSLFLCRCFWFRVGARVQGRSQRLGGAAGIVQVLEQRGNRRAAIL
jgi:hypothetical protein